jgi:hypothetical protein
MPRTLRTAALLLSLKLSTMAFAASAPAELFSPLVPAKVAAAFNALPTPVQYPQYTDTTAGKWLFFSPDTWTSGFFPVTGYALNTRKALCGATPANGLGQADWLDLGRAASNGLLDLDANHGIGHDVGFISFPFVEELLVCVTFAGLDDILVYGLLLETPRTRPRSTRSTVLRRCSRRASIQ